MYYVQTRYKLFIALLAFWFLLQLNFRVETVIIGVLTSLLITHFGYNIVFEHYTTYYQKIQIRVVLRYLAILFIEIYKSGFLYVVNLWSKEYEPVVFNLDIDYEDPILTSIIANSITLTPGTISVEVDSHNQNITVLMLAKKGDSIPELKKSLQDKFNTMLNQSGGDQK